MKYCGYLIICFFISAKIFAGTVDTVSVYSNSMHKAINCVVIKPDAYNGTDKRFPVVYLLHGYSGNYSNWITKVPALKTHADTYNILIVCPDGNYSSWYFDSPVDSTYRYETYITSEVVQYIDTHYKTIADKEHRAITGLSMGGHGALFLGLRHSDTYGAAGSMSGGVDLNESRNKFDIAKRIGDTIRNANNWKNLSVINLVENFTGTNLKIIFDCGIDDIFIKGNRKLHQKMLQLKIPHDYYERPGKHNWAYWGNSVDFQLLYFYHFFNSN
ncbi:MAG: alpha/beta hydrolase family protein [Ferruginibacter sp.]|nr:esterase family protein [Bacteroidota bacterium]MBX2919795.1 esterase family protein [Ferruginibacter sp.]MCB0709325.1 esterase family protein [Chitinophagaceae bacterium]MCC7379179.1 esterase family protein [Chitinophagaceae bacterium]